MNSNKVFALSAGLTLAATLFVSASASAATSSPSLSNRANISQTSALFGANTVAGFELAREKEPKDDRGKDRDKHDKDRGPKTHKVMASGSNKPCQLYYGCVTPPVPAPKGGGGKDNPKGHKFASTAIELQIAREKQPKDDRGNGGKDRDTKGHKLLLPRVNSWSPGSVSPAMTGVAITRTTTRKTTVAVMAPATSLP